MPAQYMNAETRRFDCARLVLQKIVIPNQGRPQFSHRLPIELTLRILEFAEIRIPNMSRPSTTLPAPSAAMTAPANSSATLMSLPTELRRQIFVESLPSKDEAQHPMCGDEEVTSPRRKSKPDIKPRRNQTSDLMVTSKKICQEITEVMYEERFFVIHVHEGLRNGGIEFLDTGRQPLQYQDCIEDTRFLRFGKMDEFGFCRLKTFKVVIFPPKEDHGRHTTINTYFMITALCRLLERPGGEKNRITRLEIEFAKPKSNKSAVGRRAIQVAEQYWWDVEKGSPRDASIHNLSKVQLVLRPFAIITGCHAVNIKLPASFCHHQPTIDFVSGLLRSMTEKNGRLFFEDDLEMKIESARYALEEYVNYTLHGKGYHDVPKMTESEMREDEDEEKAMREAPEASPRDTGQSALQSRLSRARHKRRTQTKAKGGPGVPGTPLATLSVESSFKGQSRGFGLGYDSGMDDVDPPQAVDAVPAFHKSATMSGDQPGQVHPPQPQAIGLRSETPNGQPYDKSKGNDSLPRMPINAETPDPLDPDNQAQDSGLSTPISHLHMQEDEDHEFPFPVYSESPNSQDSGTAFKSRTTLFLPNNQDERHAGGGAS